MCEEFDRDREIRTLYRLDASNRKLHDQLQKQIDLLTSINRKLTDHNDLIDQQLNDMRELIENADEIMASLTRENTTLRAENARLKGIPSPATDN